MILVTGGTGFLGAYLVPALLERGHPVRVLARTPEKVKFEKHPKLEIVQGDISDLSLLEKAFEGVTKVIHAAAVVSFWKKRRPEMDRINVDGTANLVNLSLQLDIEQFVYISSIAALGRTLNGETIDEKTKWKESNQNSYYAITKYRGEKEVIRGIAEGLKGVILNPGVILGPGNWESGTPKIFKTVASGLKFYNRGASGFVGVHDVYRAICAVVEANKGNGEKYILVSENRKYQDFLSEIATELGKKPPSKPVSAALGTFAGTLAEWTSNITGKEPLLTRETGRFSAHAFTYDGSRITRDFPFTYDPLSKVIKETAQAYLNQNGNSGKRK